MNTLIVIALAVLAIAGPLLALKKDRPLTAFIMLNTGMILTAVIGEATDAVSGMSLGFFIGAALFVASFNFIAYRSVVDMRVRVIA